MPTRFFTLLPRQVLFQLTGTSLLPAKTSSDKTPSAKNPTLVIVGQMTFGIFSLAVVSLAICAPALAAPPTDQEARHLMRVTQVDPMILSSLDALKPMLQRPLEARSEEMAASDQPGFVKAATQQLDTSIQNLKKHEVVESLRQHYQDAIQQTLTAEEVAAMIRFYDTPIGQSILAKTPQVTATYYRLSQPDMKQRLQQEMERITKSLPQPTPDGHGHSHKHDEEHR